MSEVGRPACLHRKPSRSACGLHPRTRTPPPEVDSVPTATRRSGQTRPGIRIPGSRREGPRCRSLAVDQTSPTAVTALIQLTEPVNRFPDYVRYLVRQLKALCPTMGKVRIAQTLARAARGGTRRWSLSGWRTPARVAGTGHVGTGGVFGSVLLPRRSGRAGRDSQGSAAQVGPAGDSRRSWAEQQPGLECALASHPGSHHTRSGVAVVIGGVGNG